MNANQRSAYMWGLVGKNPSLAVPWYLGTSWLHYIWDVSLIEDTAFDQLCVLLKERYEELSHRHKHLVDREALTAGTGFYLRDEDLPGICKSAFTRLAIEDRYFTWSARAGHYVRAP